MLNNKDQMHPEDRRNMIFFAVAAMLVWFGYEKLFIQPQLAQIHMAQQQEQALKQSGFTDTTAIKKPRADVLAASNGRVEIDTPSLTGSIALTGGRLDDIRLVNYAKKLNDPAKVELLSPSESDYPLYVDFGWMPDGQEKPSLPDAKSKWQEKVPGAVLKPGSPVTITWDNGQGLTFERSYEVDDRYMITVTQRVVNNAKSPITLYPYALISQQGLPEEYNARMHEGPIGYLDGKLTEIAYKKMMKNFDRQDISASSGWIGISEEYWFTGLIPAAGETVKYSFLHMPPPTSEGRHRFQVDAVGQGRAIAPGETVTASTRVFTGAKEVKQLEAYEKSLQIPHFDLVVDFGIYYFMTKPLFGILHYFYGLVGNIGVAIIMLTVLVRTLVFPLANISYRAFAQLRKVAPQMKELREKYGNDKVQMQQELVKLYEKENVNPMAGCLPMLVQIPIFFALYKVMIITIELRHAPFFGWIHDLSAPDPTTIFNLFGLIPWDPPHALMIGAWPLMMLGTQLLQRNMNPPPQDKMQAYMINIMPFFFCYIMAGFASGLVVYWTFSGALGVLQQYILMRSMGVEVHLFRRAKADEDMEKKVMEQPTIHPELEKLEEDIEHAITGDDEPSEPKPKKKKK